MAAIIVLVLVILIVKRKKHIIAGLTGVHAGKEIKLGRERVVFGRDPSQCSVVYPANQKGISRRHCEIYYEQKERKRICCLTIRRKERSYTGKE